MSNEPIHTINEELDLLAELSKATEAKPEPIQAPNTLSIDSDSDFLPEPEPPAPIVEDKEKKDTEEISAEELTDLVIDTADLIIETTFPYLYRSTLEPDTLQTLNTIVKEYKKAKVANKKEVVLDEKQQEAMEVYIDYDDYVNNLALEDKEKKKLRGPLKKVLSSVNFKASPGNALIIVAIIIMAPRLLPLLKNYFSKK